MSSSKELLHSQQTDRPLPPALNENYADFIIEYRGDLIWLGDPRLLQDISVIDSRFAVLYVPDTYVSLNTFTAASYGNTPKCYTYMDTASLNESGISRIQNHPYLDLKGRETAVAIIDSGIDYTLPEFRNSDGTTRIAYLWDQRLTDAPPPDGFEYGSEYTAEDINQALKAADPHQLVPSTDDNGHGTFLAGIAAGGENPAHSFSGVAPLSTLIVIRLKPAKKYLRDLFLLPPDQDVYQENDIMLAVRYAMKCSEKLHNIPVSICIGLGSNFGSHTGVSPLEQYLDSVGRTFRTCICLPAGNEGNTRGHYHGINVPGPAPDIAELRVAEKEPGFTLELWGNSLEPYFLTLQSPSGESAQVIPSRSNSTQEIRFIFTRSVIYITSIPLDRASGNQVIVFRFLTPDAGIWKFSVATDSPTEVSYHMWLPVRGLIKEETYFLRSSPYETVTAPGASQSPITVTAYDYRNMSLYLEASRGFTPLSAVKPELAAPGVELIGPLPGGRFTTRSGTSLAAAHTAGVAALIFEWAVTRQNIIGLNGIGLKNLLIRSARRTDNVSYPSREWGYGILDLYNSFATLF